jgi:diadenosine tetraphosphate (Ap4A) HIT family hydrolase
MPDPLNAEDCAFCQASVAPPALWESEHYCIIPDAFPRCAGHVLLITKYHFASHMHAPADGMPEFLAAEERMRSFLLRAFGKATFYENGGARQVVPHAHLHGLPFHPAIKPKWLEKGYLDAIGSWEDARRECEAVGHYFYLETPDGRYLIRRYKKVLDAVRDQLVGQTEARVQPDTGKMIRGGAEMVARTRELWRSHE